jgi:hypothetical protein
LTLDPPSDTDVPPSSPASAAAGAMHAVLASDAIGSAAIAASGANVTTFAASLIAALRIASTVPLASRRVNFPARASARTVFA